MVDGEEHTSGEGFGDDPSGTYVYENVSTFQFDIDCGTVPSKGAIWSIVSTQLGINLIDQAVKPNIAYSSATFTLTEDTVVTYTTATSATSGETWILNGMPNVIPSFSYDVTFESDGATYSKISASGSGPMAALYYDNISVYSGMDGWVSVAYQTITFATPPSGDLLTWLQANAVKQ